MNIAICDNEEMFVKNISGLLEEYLNENKLQYSIDMYSSGSELIGLKDKIVNYDIVFLDINMTGIDNIKVAEWIRMYSDRVIIISITLMSDYNIQGYKYDVFRCVLKDSMDLKGSIFCPFLTNDVSLYKHFEPTSGEYEYTYFSTILVL